MRKISLTILCCTAVLLASYTGYRSYKTWKQRHMLALARSFIAKHDGRNAVLSVSQVLNTNPRNVEACRLMAELTEAARQPNALAWRTRVVELNPHSLDDRISLAGTALTMGDLASATNALEGVDAADKIKPRYLNVAGTVAAKANRPAQAESHFIEAIRLEPENPVPQINLAIVRLHGTNQTAITESRGMLERISSSSTNSNLRCQALRELALYALADKQTTKALTISKQLLGETNSSFNDRLLRLSVLKEAKSPELKQELSGVQRSAADDSAKIFSLANWQIANTSPAETLAWMRTLPENTQTNQPVALLSAECQIMLGDWKGLQASLEKQNWGESEFIRHSFSARALRGQNLTEAGKGEWGLALKEANGQKASLIMLLRLAAQWGWLSEGEDILWSIVNRYPDEKWASKALGEALYNGGRTRSLMALYTQELKRNPTDLAVKNNLAMTALLLDAKELKPYDLAREVYEKFPTNASFASTYAFALHVQEKNDEALKIFQQLKPEILENPGISGYYGLVLQATGSSQQAKKYLEIASKVKTLPEEKKLFEAAKSKG